MKLSAIKIISFVSFLLICSVGKDDLPIFIYMILGLFDFINDIISLSFSQHDILWEGIVVIPIVGTWYVFFSSRKYKDRYLMLFCFIALLSIVIAFVFPNIYSNNSIPKLRLSFIIPFVIFVITFVYALVLIFRNKIDSIIAG
ncbi:hypothetical protein ACQ7CU_23570 [Chryseobacterium arthrosphaerae]|uniref:hypothetical protein n=1 Tax=Chryseobacterium arthrosphaerae TaxID=651561 RepID=UPI003D34069D